jgi:M6 family metalloprotease-like protein
MRNVLPALLLLLSFVPLRAYSQPVPPAPGVELPQAYFDRVAVDRTAFQFQRAWIQKAERARAARREYLDTHYLPGMSAAAIPDAVKPAIMVAGTIQVPVFLGKFSNTGAAPYAASNLQSKLFSPPPALSITGLYNEMSYGNVTLTGTVHDWVTVVNTDTYYEGGCNGICGAAKTGQFLLELLQANDATVNFGLYDNDGPDGVPNSGDDDGFVDFVAFVHPETGGECGGTNIWSHRWVVGGWPEFGKQPWTTNDPRAGGGFIKVWDYTIQPALGSENGCGTGIIEVGVFCHEFGHAFGLPDLYDTNGGSNGIGHWGLMGSGNWNKPTNPAHMSAWSKAELGWVLPAQVGPTAQTYSIHSVGTMPEVYKLDIMEQKFSRKSVAGSYRLHCGLTAEEAAARGWPKGAGYGNEWNESIRRDFTYSGAGSVTLEYDYMYHTEADYDYGYMKIDVNGSVTTLASYDGVGAGHAVINLTPYLSGAGATSYRLIAQFRSDTWMSDEDGDFDSGLGGPFIIDNVSVVGGGENYFANFEEHENGWYYDFSANPSKEYFLVENRNAAGAQFDQFLHGQGLAIWHVEQNMMAPGGLGNTGGEGAYNNTTIRGVTLEEADGRMDLQFNMNRGDGGDVYPGTSANTAFTNQTTPNSKSHNDAQTHVLVQNISAPGTVMTATMRAGFVPPQAASISPVAWYNDQPAAAAEVLGSGFVHGAVFVLRDGAHNEYAISGVKWVGRSVLAGTLDLSGVPAASYRALVRNPDGQEAILPDWFPVKSIVPVFIRTFDARPRVEGIELVWEILADEPVEGFRISRRAEGASTAAFLLDGRLIESDRRSFLDETVSPGTEYEYFLTVVFDGGTEQVSQGTRAASPAFSLALFQNSPNPFNPSTRITFSLPERMHVSIGVYDPQGRRVVILVDEVRPGGMNEVSWDGRNAAGGRVTSGVYFYRLETERGALTRKMLVLK